jgi:3-methyladenine DNA glycosylase/8-oxoguanine DNA glycosylase
MTTLAGAPDATRTFVPPHVTDACNTLRPLWRGAKDPTMRVGRTAGDGVWRATRTPEGPCTQHITQVGQKITMRAWGPGAQWSVERAPVMVGANDDDGEFSIDPHQHELLHRTWRRSAGVRTACTFAVWELLFRVILEQKVTGLEAGQSLGRLLRVFGEPPPPAPGAPRLLLPPDPRRVADTPHHVFMAANVERKRADTIRQAASYAHRLDEAAGISLEEAYRRLRALPGVGEWTINEVGVLALGDSDAVSVGDYHLKNWVSWALADEPRGTDERMVELLEPYRPYRARMMRIISLAGQKAPQYGPRITIQQRW